MDDVPHLQEAIGFLIKGKFSNIGSGESVNCDLTDREENDIHLNVVQSKPPANPADAQLKDLECASAVVEISPHFRPDAWDQLGTLQKTTPNATAAKKIAALDLRRPMRFTGQAMSYIRLSFVFPPRGALTIRRLRPVALGTSGRTVSTL